MLITLIVNSLLNGTTPIVADDVPYNINAIYVGSIHEESDFQKLYSNFTSKGKSLDSCDLTLKGCKATEPKDGTNGYLWVTNCDVSDKNLSELLVKNKIVFKTGEEIVAPFSGTLVTKVSKSDQGTYLEFISESKAYKITIKNMGRWWCCRDRKPSMSENPNKKFTHTSEHENNEDIKFKANDLLGFSTSKTEIIFLKDFDGTYKEISPEDFYK